jgi:hypothetical protein
VSEGRYVIFGQKFPDEKGNVSQCFASSFVAKLRGEVFANFHAVTVKRHSSMRNRLFGLPALILCEQYS